MNFNSIDDKFLILAYGCQGDIVIIRKFDINGMSIISLRKDNFTDRVFTLMLAYSKKDVSLDEFSRVLEYLLVANSVEVIAGGFNYDLSKVSLKRFLDYMI